MRGEVSVGPKRRRRWRERQEKLKFSDRMFACQWSLAWSAGCESVIQRWRAVVLVVGDRHPSARHSL